MNRIFALRVGKSGILELPLFADAIQISMDAAFDRVRVFNAKTSELLDYYRREFGARQVGSYDPFWLVIWEDAAERLIAEYRRDTIA